MMYALALLLAGLLQDSVTIPKGHKELYKKAATDCKEAARILESNPKGAVELLDSILGDDKIEKRECKLRIEIRSNEYTDWYDFFPHHFRGRACLLLSEKEEDREKASKWAERAIADLKESVKRGLAGSSVPLKKAEERLASLKATHAELEPEFRGAWKLLVDAGRFSAAREHVRTKGGFLSDAKRKEYEAETERLCREQIAWITEEFARSLERASGRRDLVEMRRDKFESSFGVPDAANLVVKSDSLDWCRAVRETLLLLRDGKDTLARFFDHAVAACALAADGPNRWFSAVERLADEEARDRIAARATEARDAAAAQRKKLREEAESVRTQWQAFEARVRRTGRQVPARDFGSVLDGFPLEEDLATPFHARLEAILEGEAAEESLAKFAQELAGLRADDLWPRRALESRQAILRYQLIAGTFVGWLAGKTTDDIVADLRKPGRELKQLGGTMEEPRFGTKIAEIFARLR